MRTLFWTNWVGLEEERPSGAVRETRQMSFCSLSGNTPACGSSVPSSSVLSPRRPPSPVPPTLVLSPRPPPSPVPSSLVLSPRPHLLQSLPLSVLSSVLCEYSHVPLVGDSFLSHVALAPGRVEGGPSVAWERAAHHAGLGTRCPGVRTAASPQLPRTNPALWFSDHPCPRLRRLRGETLQDLEHGGAREGGTWVPEHCTEQRAPHRHLTRP